MNDNNKCNKNKLIINQNKETNLIIDWMKKVGMNESEFAMKEWFLECLSSRWRWCQLTTVDLSELWFVV